MAGFTVLDFVLMYMGQRSIYFVGVLLLRIVAAWIICIWYAENTGRLEDKPAAQDVEEAALDQDGPERSVTLTKSN